MKSKGSSVSTYSGSERPTLNQQDIFGLEISLRNVP